MTYPGLTPGELEASLPLIVFADPDPEIFAEFEALTASLHTRVLHVSRGEDALRMCARVDVAVLVCDENLPDIRGSQVAFAARRDFPGTIRVAMDTRPTVSRVLEAVNELHVFQYLCKPIDGEAWTKSISAALREYHMGARSQWPELLALAREQIELVRELHGAHCSSTPSSLPAPQPEHRAAPGPRPNYARVDASVQLTISPRERQVIESLFAGSRVVHIADSLGISAHTVRNHLKSIFQKLGVHSQTELIELLRGVPQAQGKQSARA